MCDRERKLRAEGCQPTFSCKNGGKLSSAFCLCFLSMSFSHKYSQTPTYALIDAHYSHQASPQPSCHCLHCCCHGNTSIPGNPMNRMQWAVLQGGKQLNMVAGGDSKLMHVALKDTWLPVSCFYKLSLKHLKLHYVTFHVIISLNSAFCFQ